MGQRKIYIRGKAKKIQSTYTWHGETNKMIFFFSIRIIIIHYK